jgi:hypothetical protein
MFALPSTRSAVEVPLRTDIAVAAFGPTEELSAEWIASFVHLVPENDVAGFGKDGLEVDLSTVDERGIVLVPVIPCPNDRSAAAVATMEVECFLITQRTWQYSDQTVLHDRIAFARRALRSATMTARQIQSATTKRGSS